jgi:hypothetical protein
MMNAMAESEPLKKWVEMDYARDNACAWFCGLALGLEGIVSVSR